jgi:hypothetical protein
MKNASMLKIQVQIPNLASEKDMTCRVIILHEAVWRLLRTIQTYR